KFVAKKEFPDPEGHLIEAAEKLALICGIPLDADDTEPRLNPSKRQKSPCWENNDGSATAPSLTPRDRENGKAAASNPPLTYELKVDRRHPYLSERGRSADIIEAFGLGYCASDKSIMRQRIVIPIHNERGELVAYAGRWPGDSGWPEDTDKYMLPPKFQKMRVLFNLNRVIEGMFEAQWPGHVQHVVVVEGFFGLF